MKRLVFLVILCAIGVFWMRGTFDVPVVDEMMGKVMPLPSPGGLVMIPGSKIQMEKSAADAFVQMQNAARKDNVILIPHSGYRSATTQQYLWNSFLKKYGAKYTAKVLKPPGESEHQTGYALDIDDGKDMACSLQRCFKDSPAYKWLTENAAKFNFELSYPEGNAEGIAFEPWHWRFIGTPAAIKALKE